MLLLLLPLLEVASRAAKPESSVHPFLLAVVELVQKLLGHRGELIAGSSSSSSSNTSSLLSFHLFSASAQGQLAAASSVRVVSEPEEARRGGGVQQAGGGSCSATSSSAAARHRSSSKGRGIVRRDDKEVLSQVHDASSAGDPTAASGLEAIELVELREQGLGAGTEVDEIEAGALEKKNVFFFEREK